MFGLVLIWVMLMPGTGLAAESGQGTRVSLSASAVREVANDEVVIRFRVEARGKDLAKLRQQVNRRSEAIRQALVQEKGLKLETLNRRVEPVWKPNQYNRVREGWLVVQTGMVISRHLERVPRWLQAIEQAGAILQGLSFRVSDALRRKVMDALRIEAIARFRAKATSIAKALDATSFQIQQLQVNAATPMPPVRERGIAYAKRMVADDAVPSLSAGDSRLSARVSGDILLNEQRFSVR